MNRNLRRALVGVLALVAVAGGVGTTKAMFNDDADQPIATVTSGAITLSDGGTPTAANVSPDGFDGPMHEAITDFSTYAIYPGDVIAVAQPLKAKLVGDNLDATLEVAAPEIEDGPAAQWVRVSASVYEGDRKATALPATALTERPDGGYLVEGSGTYTVVLTYTFDAATPNLTGLAPEEIVSGSAEVTLWQVRPDGTRLEAA